MKLIGALKECFNSITKTRYN